MVRLLWFMKRKPGLSFAQFRDHFENVHVPLGQQYFGHLFAEYRRHYDLANADEPVRAHSRIPASGYDCISEWLLHDDAAVAEWRRLHADPVIGSILTTDSDTFLDKAATRVMICDTCDTGTGDGAEALKLLGR